MKPRWKKLEGWAEDLKTSLERDIKELDRDIRLAKKEARQAATLEIKVQLHKKTKDLEKRRNEKRHKLYEAQDEIDNKKDGLLSEIEGKLQQKTDLTEIVHHQMEGGMTHITASTLYDYVMCPHRVWRDKYGPQSEKLQETNPFVEMLWERGRSARRKYHQPDRPLYRPVKGYP